MPVTLQLPDLVGAMLRGFDNYWEKQQARRKLQCPYCGHAQSVGDDERLITLFGTDIWDEEGITVECHSCEREYTAIEMVERTYECQPLPEQEEESEAEDGNTN